MNIQNRFNQLLSQTAFMQMIGKNVKAAQKAAEAAKKTWQASPEGQAEAEQEAHEAEAQKRGLTADRLNDVQYEARQAAQAVGAKFYGVEDMIDFETGKNVGFGLGRLETTEGQQAMAKAEQRLLDRIQSRRYQKQLGEQAVAANVKPWTPPEQEVTNNG